MKERGLPLPVAFPRVHARGVYVIYDDGRPLVEAYDGPQIVGMDLHRRRSVLVRMSEDGRKLATARITNSRRGWRRRSPGRACTPRWCWRPATAGTGRRTRWQPPAPRCTWRTRWV